MAPVNRRSELIDEEKLGNTEPLGRRCALMAVTDVAIYLYGGHYNSIQIVHPGQIWRFDLLQKNWSLHKVLPMDDVDFDDIGKTPTRFNGCAFGSSHHLNESGVCHTTLQESAAVCADLPLFFFAFAGLKKDYDARIFCQVSLNRSNGGIIFKCHSIKMIHSANEEDENSKEDLQAFNRVPIRSSDFTHISLWFLCSLENCIIIFHKNISNGCCHARRMMSPSPSTCRYDIPNQPAENIFNFYKLQSASQQQQQQESVPLIWTWQKLNWYFDDSTDSLSNTSAISQMAHARNLFPFTWLSPDSACEQIGIISIEHAHDFSRQRWAEKFPDLSLQQRKRMLTNPNIMMPHVFRLNLTKGTSQILHYNNYDTIFNAHLTDLIPFGLGPYGEPCIFEKIDESSIEAWTLSLQSLDWKMAVCSFKKLSGLPMEKYASSLDAFEEGQRPSINKKFTEYDPIMQIGMDSSLIFFWRSAS